MGVYIHWPFCLSKCPYCDFNSHVRASIDQDDWQAAYVRAIEEYAAKLPGRIVQSIFFGGGTPSLMPPQTAEAIIYAIQKNWRVSNDVEITLEANPTSVEIEKFKDFRSAGVNRVSLGVQALNDKDLKFLGREHSAVEATRAIDTARTVFDRYSFDLIYARPEQDLKSWERELGDAQQHFDGHLSLYQLTIERNTPFYMSHAQGEFSIPDQDLGADFYNLTQDVMEGFGLPAYEVSNHAKPGAESQHNMTYWRYGDYIGVGPGAHGRLRMNGQKYATREHQSPEIWLKNTLDCGGAAHPFEALDERSRFVEALMMGLRLRGGVSVEDLERSSGAAGGVDRYLHQDKLKEARTQGWIEAKQDRLSLSREGWLRMNALIPYLLKD